MYALIIQSANVLRKLTLGIHSLGEPTHILAIFTRHFHSHISVVFFFFLSLRALTNPTLIMIKSS